MTRSPAHSASDGPGEPTHDHDPDANSDEAAESRRAAARRRRRIDEVFGEVLPSTTDDERESGHHGGFSLEHYRSSRPPHWGTKQ
jgi:hypothetical protein